MNYLMAGIVAAMAAVFVSIPAGVLIALAGYVLAEEQREVAA